VAVAFAVGFAGQAMAQAVCGTVVGDDTDGLPTALTGYIEWGGAAFPGPICLEEPVFIGDPTKAGATAGSPPATLRSCTADTTVTINNPAASPATECRGHLTILPGTVVRGQPRRLAPGTIDGNPGALIVTRDSYIDADGTPDAPIILTTAAVDNDLDGACDDEDVNGRPDRHPGFVPGSGGALACTPANACVPEWCDMTPLAAPLAPLDTNGRENVRLWGGFALVGNAPGNLGDDEGVGYGEGVLEGIQVPQTDIRYAEYCGSEPHDNSGVIRYVSVRHAGDELAPANELNGVSLGCIGDGTIYEYVEVYNNQDDGHEWFGGTVNGNHLVTAYAGDDQFDLDEGFTGALQFVFTIMPFFNEDNGNVFGVESGDRLGEWDGINAGNVVGRIDDDGAAEVPIWPWHNSNPTVWNFTGIGSTTDGANPALSPAALNEGIVMTALFSGQVSNSIIVNTGAEEAVDCNAAGGIGGRSCSTIDDTRVDLVRLVSSCTFDTGAATADVVARGNEWSDFVTPGVAIDATFRNATGATDVLVQEDPAANFTGKGGATCPGPECGKVPFTGQLAGYDPRPILGGDCDLPGLRPQDTGLDRAATYRGAFEPGAIELWTTGWTAIENGDIIVP
jgi:hypothetical protein